VTDLLTPDEVRAMELKAIWPYEDLAQLCRNYLTLWDELEAERELSDKLVKQVRELEQRNEWLNECLNEEQADRNAR